MRSAVLLSLLLTGCAASSGGSRTDSRTARGNVAVSAEEQRMDTRADSLLALPPDSLAAADVAWLQAYSARKGDEGTVTDAERRGIGAIVLGTMAAVAGIISLFIVASRGE
ncbi:MAG: hypothetical protein AAFU38_14070 [Bacteroidota bacterium]